MSYTTIPPTHDDGPIRPVDRTPGRARVRIKQPWSAIPNAIMTDTRLSRDARLLGALLYMHAGNTGRAFPSQELLAEELGVDSGCKQGEPQPKPVSVRSVQRWLRELRHVGWIEWRQTLKHNEYSLLESDETQRVVSALDEPPSQMDTTAVTESISHTPLPTPDHSIDTADTPAGATALSCHTATPASSRATAVSSPNATRLSLSNKTQRSASTTPVSRSSIHVDSLILDPSTTEPISTHQTGDDGDYAVSRLDQQRPTASKQPHTVTSAWLGERGVNAAREFRHESLDRVQQIYRETKQRQPDATPGTITNALRASVASRRFAALHEVCEMTAASSIINSTPFTTVHEHLSAAVPALDYVVQSASTNLAVVWADTMDNLRIQVPRTAFDLTFRPVSLKAITGNIATIAAPSRQAKERLEVYGGALRVALSESVGRAMQIRVVIAPGGN